MKPVRTLSELRALSQSDPRYRELTTRASCLLGARQDDPLYTHEEWLTIYALATSEEYVLGQVNLLLPNSSG